MFVERWTWKVKSGRSEEMVELSRAEKERFGLGGEHGIYRIYESWYGPLDTVVGEWEFETLEQRDKAVAEWWSQPEAKEWARKTTELIESGTHERWNLY